MNDHILGWNPERENAGGGGEEEWSHENSKAAERGGRENGEEGKEI